MNEELLKAGFIFVAMTIFLIISNINHLSKLTSTISSIIKSKKVEVN